MTARVRSELLKVRTTRGWYAYLVVLVLLSGIAVAGDLGSTSADRSDLRYQVNLVQTAGIAALLAIILGITITTAEFRHGTITPTFLASPRRELVIGAKAAAGVLLAVGFALLALAVVAAVALPWLAIVDESVHVGDGMIATRAAQQVLLAVLWVLLGVGVGTLVHSQVAALVGTLIWIFVGETLLLGLFGLLDLEGARAYLPFQALDGASGQGSGDLLSYWPAVGVSFCWIALIGAAGLERTRRRDIT